MKIIKIAMPMKTDKDLGEDCRVEIDDSEFDNVWSSLAVYVLCYLPEEQYNTELGNIFISKTNSSDSRWENTYYVTDVNAEKGWGPLLYDKALGYLSSRGKYLISNEEATYRQIDLYGGGTSGPASNVWKHYDHKRDDVIRERAGYRMNKGSDQDENH